MLTKTKIEYLISHNDLLTSEDVNRSDILNQVQSSSVDLTIKAIYSATDGISSKQRSIENCGSDIIELSPGQTVVIQVAEKFKMPNSLGGIIFPPNSMSKAGIVMTNPGHIDPNFEGFISVYLVNMGKTNVTLEKNDKVATLLLFSLDGELPNKMINGTGVSKKQVLTLSKDFADLDTRLPFLLSSFIRNKALIWGGLSITIVAIFFTFIPVASKMFFDDSKIEAFYFQHVTPLKAALNESSALVKELAKDSKAQSLAISQLDKEVKIKDEKIQSLNQRIEKLYTLFDSNFKKTMKEKGKDEN
ncbi:hypothetical protein HHL01_19110 [Pseudoalteromonas arctica]|uniref:dUTPase-like domain-containing protein n=1 Tax=Pseudoalteromonas arctica TaxID=394751 RepID=A0A7X9UAI3_9GAMM|nr:hypothetical protein [Pseudoalteromonas arctica]NMF50258.1 hypothetical protein [Pseudoalteromonas arctica]